VAAPAPPPPTATAPAISTQLSGCALLSEAEASEAAGLPMRVTSPPGTSGCVLDSVPLNLTVEFIALTRTAVFDQIAGHQRSQPIAGIGDAAYFVGVEGRTLAQLHVARGDRMLITTLHLEREGPDLKSIAERVGRTIAPRL
jgi:hypothetical protein